MSREGTLLISHKVHDQESPVPIINSTQTQPKGGPQDLANGAKEKVTEGFLQARAFARAK